MYYGWHELPEVYFTLKDGTLIGANIACKFFEENYNLYEKPWELHLEAPVRDFDLIDTLLSTEFDIYTKTTVKRLNDGKPKIIWQKYSDAEIERMSGAVDFIGEPANFVEVFIASVREQIHENGVPKEVKNFKK